MPNTTTVSTQTGLRRALRIFQAAAERVPAYKQFLKQVGIRPASVKTATDFSALPIMDKQNYIGKFTLAELCWDGQLSRNVQLPMSSGTSGAPHFWPTLVAQDSVSGRSLQRILRDCLGVEHQSTLFVITFGLGSWKAGLEFYNAARWVQRQGTELTIITPGLELQEIVRELEMLAPSYDKIVIAGYPPFLKDILVAGSEAGFNWLSHDVSLLGAGEPVSEAWRDHVLGLLGKPNDLWRMTNVYGMAEIGAIAYETPHAIHLRRRIEAGELIVEGLEVDRLTAIYQYSPQAHYMEIGEHDNILLTAHAGLPLVRYMTRDRGGLLDTRQASRYLADDDAWHAPLVYLYDRDDLSVQLYSVNIYTDNIKKALDLPQFKALVTGIFVMSVVHDAAFNQQLNIEVELVPSGKLSTQSANDVRGAIYDTLTKHNSEYRKLSSTMGDKVLPTIKLVENGKIGYVPGRKHKWVKRG